MTRSIFKTIDEAYSFIINIFEQNKVNIKNIYFKKEIQLALILFILNEEKEIEITLIYNKVNEIPLNAEPKIVTLFKINEMQNKLSEENALLKKKLKNLEEQLSKKEKIQSGEYLAKFSWDSKHYMHSSKGPRSFKIHINFNEKYEKIPHVMVSLKGLDINGDRNIRIYVFSENVSVYGFDLVIGTWNDSLIYEVNVSWISYG